MSPGQRHATARHGRLPPRTAAPARKVTAVPGGDPAPGRAARHRTPRHWTPADRHRHRHRRNRSGEGQVPSPDLRCVRRPGPARTGLRGRHRADTRSASEAEWSGGRARPGVSFRPRRCTLTRQPPDDDGRARRPARSLCLPACAHPAPGAERPRGAVRVQCSVPRPRPVPGSGAAPPRPGPCRWPGGGPLPGEFGVGGEIQIPAGAGGGRHHGDRRACRGENATAVAFLLLDDVETGTSWASTERAGCDQLPRRTS